MTATRWAGCCVTPGSMRLPLAPQVRLSPVAAAEGFHAWRQCVCSRGRLLQLTAWPPLGAAEIRRLLSGRELVQESVR